MTNEVNRTARGFREYGEFIDTYKNKIRVQQSSAAFCDRLWLFIDNDPKVLDQPGSAHMNKQQVLQLIEMLQKAADDMMFDEQWDY